MFKGTEIERFVEIPEGAPRYKFSKYYPFVHLIYLPLLFVVWWLYGLPFDPNDELFQLGFIPAAIMMVFATVFGVLFMGYVFGIQITPIIVHSEGLDMKSPTLLRWRGFPDFTPRGDISKLGIRYYNAAQSKSPTIEIGYCTMYLENGKKRAIGLRDPEKLEKFAQMVHDRYGVPIEGAKMGHQVQAVGSSGENIKAFCAHCGAPSEPGSSFCGRCGKKL
ncbi:MAG: zinc ribbon domain-containing protein [Methanomassiliicoccales archaeon]|nr:zinc ribbon domain-containing protein [Methanomassiliicoccales archaeon]